MQACGAYAIIYATKDGEPVDQDLNDTYWKIRDIGTIKIQSGFRVWDEDEDLTGEGDAPELAYTLTDFSEIQKPKPEVIVPDDLDEEEEEDTSAAALATAAATALAAFLLV